MCSVRVASLSFVVALALAPLSASAQGGPQGGGNLAARVQALEAAVAALQSGQTALTGRVSKLEGNITAADLAGTYSAIGMLVDLEGGFPAKINAGTLTGVATLNANGTGQFVGGITALGLTQGNPWTKETNSMPPEGEEITWTYANGILHLSDGTPNFDTDFVVSIGGRMATFAGLGDDGELDLIILTRTP